MRNGKIVYCQCKDNLWLSLVEKAFAQLYGSYERLQEADINEIVTMATGIPAYNYDFDRTLLFNNNFVITARFQGIPNFKVVQAV